MKKWRYPSGNNPVDQLMRLVLITARMNRNEDGGAWLPPKLREGIQYTLRAAKRKKTKFNFKCDLSIGVWMNRPLELGEIANCLAFSTRQVKSFFNDTGLHKVSRQRWLVRLDNTNPTYRQILEDAVATKK